MTMDITIIESLLKLTKMAGDFDELDAISKCLELFKIQNRKEAKIYFVCRDLESAIYQKRLDLKVIYSSKSQW